ncbi:hypothetical protein B0O99DRAFT_625326 [Bisporella sp. PMI_857]|nr:hypothetical protein B0O99DRAFT_625326 [Bisporella sp. PMI_857]
MYQIPLSTSYTAAQSQPEAITTSQPQPSENAPAPAGVSPQIYSQGLHRKKSQSSCIICRQKKVKCDRADPCSRCVRVGTICVSSLPSGAPRGRKGGRRKFDSELLDRIAKLENLVENIKRKSTGEATAMLPPANGNWAASGESEPRISTAQSAKHSPKAPKEGLDRYLGGSLWMSLSDEIHGIREALNQSSDDEDDYSDLTPASSTSSINQSGESNFIICSPEILPDMISLKHPNRSQVQALYSAFMANVDPVVKILHGPSLRRYLVEQTGEFDCSPGPKGWGALEFAIYYATTTSLTPDECLERLGEKKAFLLPKFRFSTEVALARADFINTEDMSTLQALILYLIALRSNENSRRTWTLTSLAVRISHALGLHREMCGGKYLSQYQPFEREMRRRLWWQICNLDRHASADRGSDPIIITNTFCTPLPLHVNDEDLIPDDPHDVQPREEYTDFTISLVIHEVFDIERRLNYVLAGEFDRSQEGADEPWDQRRYWALLCQQRIQDKYLRHCKVTIPIQRYTMMLADSMIANMWLWTYRPLQRRRHSPAVVTIPHSWILQVSIEVTEKVNQLLVDSSSSPFRWVSTSWVAWHALAVMIAELCVQTEGPLVERAWSVVNIVFEETARHIADSDKGRLWRPIKKLMNKAQTVRKKHLEDAASTSDSFPAEGGLRLANQIGPMSNSQFADLDFMDMEPWPKVLGDTSGCVQLLQQGVKTTDPTPANWDPWVATGPSEQMDYNNDLNQMAWRNWESFIDDFRADRDILPG